MSALHYTELRESATREELIAMLFQRDQRIAELERHLQDARVLALEAAAVVADSHAVDFRQFTPGGNGTAGDAIRRYASYRHEE